VSWFASPITEAFIVVNLIACLARPSCVGNFGRIAECQCAPPLRLDYCVIFSFISQRPLSGTILGASFLRERIVGQCRRTTRSRHKCINPVRNMHFLVRVHFVSLLNQHEHELDVCGPDEEGTKVRCRCHDVSLPLPSRLFVPPSNTTSISRPSLGGPLT
jgi:hypothetical protein